MEILGIILVGAAILNALSGGKSNNNNADHSTYATKHTSDWMRTTHIDDERRRKEREENNRRKNGW